MEVIRQAKMYELYVYSSSVTQHLEKNGRREFFLAVSLLKTLFLRDHNH